MQVILAGRSEARGQAALQEVEAEALKEGEQAVVSAVLVNLLGNHWSAWWFLDVFGVVWGGVFFFFCVFGGFCVWLIILVFEGPFTPFWPMCSFGSEIEVADQKGHKISFEKAFRMEHVWVVNSVALSGVHLMVYLYIERDLSGVYFVQACQRLCFFKSGVGYLLFKKFEDSATDILYLFCSVAPIQYNTSFFAESKPYFSNFHFLDLSLPKIQVSKVSEVLEYQKYWFVTSFLACLLAFCLPACLLACLLACLPACLLADLTVLHSIDETSRLLRCVNAGGLAKARPEQGSMPTCQ